MIVTLELSPNVALVLFELLSRFEQNDDFEITDAAERHALSSLHGILEKTLAEPFRTDYQELLEKARTEIRSRYGAG